MSAMSYLSILHSQQYQMIQNLIPYNPAHLKALFTRNRVHDHVTMDANKVLAIKNRVLVLPSRVDNLDSKVLILISNNSAKGILDRRVVGVNEVTVHILDC